MDEKKEHVLTFESDDYYGPTMKLEVNCASKGAVDFTINGDASGITASLSYTLYDDDAVEKVIAELSAWIDRLRERQGR